MSFGNGGHRQAAFGAGSVAGRPVGKGEGQLFARKRLKARHLGQVAAHAVAKAAQAHIAAPCKDGQHQLQPGHGAQDRCGQD